MPPPPQSLKHKGSARMLFQLAHPMQHDDPSSDDTTVPEPAPKRKTLAERAAEPIRSNGVPRPVNGLARAGASAATRHSSRTMPSSSRQPSFASRPTSVASSYRPASALAQSRSRSALPSMRPPPVTQDYDDDDESGGEQSAMATKRKGMNFPSLHLPLNLKNINITPRRQRTLSPLRNMSLSSAFHTLSLKSNISGAEEGSPFLSSQEEPQCPKTPCYLPKPVPKTPTQSTPARTTYLTRDSNLLAPAWDTKGRLEDMEVLYSQLKSQLDSASKENHGMEDSIDIYKTRSMPCKLHSIRYEKLIRFQSVSSRLYASN